MKNFTKYLLPRYTWFILWYKQWFKNHDGIKGFAMQAMNTLMQSTMNLAKRLKNQNMEMAEAIKTLKAQLQKRYEHAIVEADEWDEIRTNVRKTALWIFFGVATEAACNYFAIESVMEGNGWFWIGIRILVAIAVSGGCLLFFKNWFAGLINEPAYKKAEVKKRNWIKLIALTALCTGFEVAFYWLCKRRTIVLEGNSGDDTITYFVIIFGMLLPIGAGYLAYERSRYLSAYNNTLRIAGTVQEIANKESIIATNNQQMEDHFKSELHDSWTVLDEFRVYKENYNLKHSITKESLEGHFCENYESFGKEALQRYAKDALKITSVQPSSIFIKEQFNGHTTEVPQPNY